jgi:hypothetical protein
MVGRRRKRSETILFELIGSLPPSPVRAAARQCCQDRRRRRRTLALLDLALEDAAGAPAAGASVLNLRARQRQWAGDFAGAIADAQAAATRAEEGGSAAELAVGSPRSACAGVRWRACPA